ncbi:MAG TPA: hypothetical protein VMM14_01010 [Acidimicrobiia bacterium]|nr:hypothetical protein [Acidimicrobiia bacterium]
MPGLLEARVLGLLEPDGAERAEWALSGQTPAVDEGLASVPDDSIAVGAAVLGHSFTPRLDSRTLGRVVASSSVKMCQHNLQIGARF